MALVQTDHLSEAQLDQLWRLYQREWWTEGRDFAGVQRAIAESDELVAFLDADGKLAAIARVLTDYVYKALVLDVIVAEAHRGSGLGARLMTR